jgi:hypothetical protein
MAIRNGGGAAAPELPFEEQKAKADAGEAEWQFAVGMNYHLGAGGAPQSNEEAYKYFQLGAAQSEPQSLYCVGIYHLAGTGGAAQDEAQAASFFRKAADLGLANAQLQLAKCYLEGSVGVEAEEGKEGEAEEGGDAAVGGLFCLRGLFDWDLLMCHVFLVARVKVRVPGGRRQRACAGSARRRRARASRRRFGWVCVTRWGGGWRRTRQPRSRSSRRRPTEATHRL